MDWARLKSCFSHLLASRPSIGRSNQPPTYRIFSYPLFRVDSLLGWPTFHVKCTAILPNASSLPLLPSPPFLGETFRLSPGKEKRKALLGPEFTTVVDVVESCNSMAVFSNWPDYLLRTPILSEDFLSFTGNHSRPDLFHLKVGEQCYCPLWSCCFMTVPERLQGWIKRSEQAFTSIKFLENLKNRVLSHCGKRHQEFWEYIHEIRRRCT